MTMSMTIVTKIWMTIGMKDRGVHASICADAIAYIVYVVSGLEGFNSF
jgi:hypothetical protein